MNVLLQYIGCQHKLIVVITYMFDEVEIHIEFDI
jgi:hypothetical protein